MLERLSTMPKVLQFEKILAQLRRIEGDDETNYPHITLSNLVCSVQEDIQWRLEIIVYDIAQKVNETLCTFTIDKINLLQNYIEQFLKTKTCINTYPLLNIC